MGCAASSRVHDEAVALKPKSSMGGKASVPAAGGKQDASKTTSKAVHSAAAPQQQAAAAATSSGPPRAATARQQGAAWHPDVVEAVGTPRSTDDDLAMLNRLLEQNTKSQIRNQHLDLTQGPSTAVGPTTLQTRASQQPAQPQAHSEVDLITPRAPDSPELRAPPKQQHSSLAEQPAGPVQAPVVAPPPDPWAQLQSAYRIQSDGPPSPTGLKGAGERPTPPRNALQADIVVLDDEDDDVTGGAGMHGRHRAYAGGAKLAAKPVQGGWGKGAMAQAGQLMVGDDELGRLAPPLGALPSAVASPPMAAEQDTEAEYAQLRARIKASSLQMDLGLEDLEDVDAMLQEEEARAGLNPSLAAKLAAFEALADNV